MPAKRARLYLPQGLAPLARHKADFTLYRAARTSSATKRTGAAPTACWCHRYAILVRKWRIASPLIRSRLKNLDAIRFSSIQLDTLMAAVPVTVPDSLAWDQRGSWIAISRSVSYFTSYSRSTSCLSRSGKKRSLKTVACWMLFSLKLNASSAV